MHSFQCVSKGRDKNECCCSIGVGQRPGAADATSKNAQQGNVLKSEHHLNARKLRLSAATKELERLGIVVLRKKVNDGHNMKTVEPAWLCP